MMPGDAIAALQHEKAAASFYGSPNGAGVAFRLAKATADEAIFINTAHDFPQRVRYLRTATGIDAEISLADGSKP